MTSYVGGGGRGGETEKKRRGEYESNISTHQVGRIVDRARHVKQSIKIKYTFRKKKKNHAHYFNYCDDSMDDSGTMVFVP
jgi:hypothetical protein